MSEVEQTKNWLSGAGTTALGMGAFVWLMEMIFVGESTVGSACCCFGIFGLIAGSIVSTSGAAVSSNGKMVLKQDATGQWNWVQDSNIPAPVTDMAANYNDVNTQIQSRVIAEVNAGKPLQDLDSNELGLLASAYGVDSGSDQQKIEALHNSELAKSALKLGAIGVAGGAGAVGAAHVIKSSREKAIERAEELKQQGRQKLQDNIDAGKHNIDSKLPKSESGESATEVANNIVLDQLKVQIERRGLTPETLLQMADSDSDGKLNAVEIAAAMTAATGFAVPVFIVQDTMKQFDVNEDAHLDINELHLLWSKLGLVDETTTESDISDEIEGVDDLVAEDALDEEIDAVLEEVSQTEVVEEVEPTDTVEIEEEVVEESTEISETHQEVTTSDVDSSEDELTDGIDTEFERLVLEMEGARFSSERKTIMERQTTEFLINMRIEKMERTLIGDPKYRGGQSVHGLLDGGPYVGVVKIPVEFDDEILHHKEGDEIQVMARLVDFSPSLKRPVLESSKIL